jgi:polyphosphate:AMP phosphotransferase
MLESLDLDRSLDKDSYRQETDRLMRQLRSLQSDCQRAKMPTLVVLEGWAASGKGQMVKQMLGHMDPRGFVVHPTLPPTAEERDRPWLWRFWLRQPARGQITIFYHSWYVRLLEDRLFGHLADPDVPTAVRQINAFERQLADDGTAIIKFFIHLGRKELKHRLKAYAKDPYDAWRVRPEDWQQAKRYKRYRALAEDALIQTSTGHAPWTLVEGNCKRWAEVKLLGATVAALTAAFDRRHAQLPPPQLPPQECLRPSEPDLLAEVDLSKGLSRDRYKQRLQEAQLRLRNLQRDIHQQKLAVLAIFEGWDAAGKGGAIKRVTDALDPRNFVVTPFAAPSREELDRHYLWRFWRSLPAAGTIGIFDRSWYGRVLVERVEGFATEPEWRRAYAEINEFESQLVDGGIVLLKFWLHISPEEQLRRFQEREVNPFKQHKLTDEDWRNRDRWPLYHVAVNHMLQRTQTVYAPWTIVAANDKLYARVKTIETVAQAIEGALARRHP